jgi:hypothetical protein
MGDVFAFGNIEPNPITPTIDGPASWKPNTPYTYIFTSIDPNEDQVSYFIEWGDGNVTDWTNFQPSGELYTESHTWTTKGIYTVRAKAKDTEDYESFWRIFDIVIPRNKALTNSLLITLLERFPLLQKLLSFIKLDS